MKRCLFDEPAAHPRTCKLNVLPEGEEMPDYCRRCKHYAEYDHPVFLGDMVEKVAKFFRLDRVAKKYEKKTGKSCGCSGRQSKLNKAHKSALDFLTK